MTRPPIWLCARANAAPADEALANHLDQRPLASAQAEIDAIPGRVARAIEQAAKLLLPKVQTISLERATLRDAAEVEAWIERSPGWPAAWRDVLGFGDDGVTVTPVQARALRDELEAVVSRYRDAGAGDPAAIRVLVWHHLLPVDMQPPEEQP